MTDETRRANYLPPRAAHELSLACREINKSFGSYGCFLVGSCRERRDWRDVDVRFILEDAEYDRLFAGRDGVWSMVCTAIAAWLQQRSGLPVDFQFQRMTQANAKHPGQRDALGCMLRYPGELPSMIAREVPDAAG